MPDECTCWGLDNPNCPTHGDGKVELSWERVAREAVEQLQRTADEIEAVLNSQRGPHAG